MKIAIIGAGISGLIAASELQNNHDVTVFEKEPAIGGHIKTTKVTFASKDGSVQVLNADMGVFMFEPKHIHPVFYDIAQKYNIETEPFYLSSALEYENDEIEWSSHLSTNNFFRYLHLYLLLFWQGVKQLKGYSYHKYLLDLCKIYKNLPNYASDKYSIISHDKFVKDNKFSDLFMECWVYPLLRLWWGATENTLNKCSISVFIDSINDVLRSQDTRIIKGGADLLPKSIADKIKNIQLNSNVTKVERKGNKNLIYVNNEIKEFEHVVIAITPNIAANILKTNNQPLLHTLNLYDTTITTVYLHTDSRFMPKSRENWAIANMLDKKGIGKFSTFWVGGTHKEQPEYFISWGQGMDKIDQNKIIQTQSFNRVLPTFNYIKASNDILQFQGKDNIWFCGAHVNSFEQGKIPSLWLDNSLLSGLFVAGEINNGY